MFHQTRQIKTPLQLFPILLPVVNQPHWRQHEVPIDPTTIQRLFLDYPHPDLLKRIFVIYRHRLHLLPWHQVVRLRMEIGILNLGLGTVPVVVNPTRTLDLHACSAIIIKIQV